MRKSIYILAILALAFNSCLRDADVPSGGDGDGEFTFAINIPGAGYITRSMKGYNDNTAENKNLLINNMWVMVFDEVGYLSRHQAYQSGGAAQFAVRLPLSDKPRVLHFVCNYDWSGFDDRAMELLNEATVMTGMTRAWSDESQPIPILYWSRVALPSGISDGMGLNGGTVTLKRNVAQVSVNNNSKAGADMDPDDEVVSYLTQVEFSIGNYLDRGTVTGFDNTLSLSDPDYAEKLFDGVYEAPNATPVPLVNGDGGKFVSGTSSSEGIAGSSIFTYERNNADPTVADHLYILIKGLYHADAAATPVLRYYKVDIVIEGDTELQDVIRNKHYILTLNQVLSNGYATIQEAADALALNNIATSVMQSYNSISDGTSILNIEYVNKTFVKARNASLPNDFAIRYSYIPDATTGATDNFDVQMEWGPRPGDDGYAYRAVEQMDNLPNHKVLLGYTGGNAMYPSGYGGEYVDRVSGRFVASLPSSGVYTSWIKISKSNLSRTINLRLRQPYEFEPMTLTPSEVPNKSGEEVAVTFNVPETLADQLPFVVYIYAEMLAPDYKKSNIYNDDSEGVFRYRYTVRSTGTQTLHFLTGSTIGQGYVTLESELFRDASRYLSRPNDNFAAISITGVSPNGASLAPETGLPVRVSFSVPSGFIAGDKIYIHTGLLEPVGPNSTSDNGAIYKNDPSDNFYTYEPSGSGGAKLLWVDFRTVANISAEQISISSEHLQTAYYDRSNYYYGFGESFVRTGDKLAVNFNLYNRTSPLVPRTVEIYIYTQNLKADTGYGDQGITEVDYESVRWLVYTTTVSAASEPRTIYLEPRGAATPETIMLSSEQYNAANYQYQ